MELIEAPEVRGILSTIGGANSSSLIPHLDFEKIRTSRKVICGFSDVSSLHLAIIKHARLRTFYGPSLMCWFGEWPDGIVESTEWFLDAVMRHEIGTRTVTPPRRWSNHRRNWSNDDWKILPREWQTQKGWQVLSEGEATGPILAVNLNTLVSCAGTPEWPDLDGRILLLEEMTCPMSRFERSLRQLDRIGAFDQIGGLLVGKPEEPNNEGAPFDRDDLLKEILGNRLSIYPVMTDVDCGHTVPMITIPQEVQARVSALRNQPRLDFLESAVAAR